MPTSSRPAASVFVECLDRDRAVAIVERIRDVPDARGADKGSAVRRLQRERGITRDQMAAFGDFLNDLTLLEAATYSFAMANAHPEVHRRAAWRAPANTESGVTAAVAALIGMDVP